MAKVFSLDAWRLNRDLNSALIEQDTDEQPPALSDHGRRLLTGQAMVKTLAPQPVTAASASTLHAVGMPCDCQPAEDDSPVTIARGAVHSELSAALSSFDVLLRQLPLIGVPTTRYVERLAALQPSIDELRRFCPPAKHPYSPCAADSRAAISKQQFEHWVQLRTQLHVLVADMETALQSCKLGF